MRRLSLVAGLAVLAVVASGGEAVAEVGSPNYDDRVYGPTARSYEGTGAPESVSSEELRRALIENEATRAALAESLRENILLKREIEAARAEIDRIRFPAPVAGAAPASAAAQTSGGFLMAPQERTYTVKRGDTLGSIAARELGSESRWPEIHRLNRDEVRNPNRIEPGQVLRLPPARP